MKVTFLPLHLLVQKIAINKAANSTALNSYSKTTCNVFSVPNFQDVVLPQTKQTRTNTWPKFSTYNFLIYTPSRFCFRLNTFLWFALFSGFFTKNIWHCLQWKKYIAMVLLHIAIIVIYLRIDKSYTIYLKLLSRFPNLQITTTEKKHVFSSNYS